MKIPLLPASSHGGEEDMNAVSLKRPGLLATAGLHILPPPWRGRMKKRAIF
jgi:hypothetical protein